MKFVYLAALVALALIGCDQRAFKPTLSPTEFRDHMATALKKQQPDKKIDATGPLQLTIEDGLLNLDTGYEEYLKNPDDLDVIVEKWVYNASATTEQKMENLVDRIVYVVRSKAYLDPKLTADGKTEPPSFLWRPFGGDLVSVLMADHPTMLASVSADDLKDANISIEEAWRLADGNLKSRLGPISFDEIELDGPMAYSAESGLATGMLVHPEGCTGPNARWNDDRIILVVDRNTFITTLPNDRLSVERFWKYAKPGIEKKQFSSDVPLMCKDRQWQTAEAPK